MAIFSVLGGSPYFGVCACASVGVSVGRDSRVARLVVWVDSQRGRPVDVWPGQGPSGTGQCIFSYTTGPESFSLWMCELCGCVSVLKPQF